jgi:hypothetical protein
LQGLHVDEERSSDHGTGKPIDGVGLELRLVAAKNVPIVIVALT